MKTPFFLTLAFALIVSTMSCAPRSFSPERDIDPSPLLRAARDRNALFQTGVSGTIDIQYTGTGARFWGKAHVIAFPDGRFRIEIPGLMGSTQLIMASDGQEVLIYYPEEGTAFRGPAHGPSIGDHLPFPLPVDAAALPSLLLGTLPGKTDPGNMGSALLSSGERTLQIAANGTGPGLFFLFSKNDPPSLRAFFCSRGDLRFEMATRRKSPFLPGTFTLTIPDARLKGEWERVELFKGDLSFLELEIPRSVPITDLEDLP